MLYIYLLSCSLSATQHKNVGKQLEVMKFAKFTLVHLASRTLQSMFQAVSKIFVGITY